MVHFSVVDFSVITFMVSTVGSHPPLNLQTDSESDREDPARERFVVLDHSMISGAKCALSIAELLKSQNMCRM